MTNGNAAVIAITDADVLAVQAKLMTFGESLTPAELGVLRMIWRTAGWEQPEVSGLEYEWWNPWSWGWAQPSYTEPQYHYTGNLIGAGGLTSKVK